MNKQYGDFLKYNTHLLSICKSKIVLTELIAHI